MQSEFLFSGTGGVKSANWWTKSGTIKDLADFALTEAIDREVKTQEEKRNLPAFNVVPLSPSPQSAVRAVKGNAYPTQFLAIDVDGGTTPDIYERAKQECSEANAFMYTTHSHMKAKNKPGKPPELAAPRWRIVFALDRTISPAERKRLIGWYLISHGLKVDSSNTNPTQPMFVAEKGSEIVRGDFSAAPLCVADILAHAPTEAEFDAVVEEQRAEEDRAQQKWQAEHPEDRPKRPQKNKPTKPAQRIKKAAAYLRPDDDGTYSDNALSSTTGAYRRLRPADDPILKKLFALGMTEGDMRPDGAVVCQCPFEVEHTTEGGEGDTSTVFYPAGTQARTDKDGKEFRLGHFNCFHSHCNGRPLDMFCEAIGVDYGEYVRYCNGETPTNFRSSGTGNQYHVHKGGLYVSLPSKDGQQPERRIGSALIPIATISDQDGNDWGMILEWKDLNGRRHKFRIDAASLMTQGATDTVKSLVSGGYKLSAKAHGNALADFLSAIPSISLPHQTGVRQGGWFDEAETGARVFVLPEQTIGLSEASVCYVGDKEKAPRYRSKGTLEGWQTEVAKWAGNSSRIALAICTAFAAPCLALTETEGGCFNLYGTSSKGKSLCLKAAGSVYGEATTKGGFLRAWDTTAVGREMLFASHNDMLLCLDEASNANKRDIGRTVYALANGIGRARGGISGNTGDITLRETAHWRVLGLSSSEQTTAELLTDAGERINAGQEVRLTDVPAVAVSDALGVFERVKSSGSADAHAIESAVREHYGTAGKHWLDYLACNITEATDKLRAHADEFMNSMHAQALPSQAERVCRRFAACAAAGEVATEKGLTGWAPGFASAQVAVCAKESLKRFTHDREKTALVRAIREATTNGIGRFVDADSTNARVLAVDNYGYRYTANPEGLRVVTDFVVNQPEDKEADTVTAFLFHKTTMKKLCNPLPLKSAVKWLTDKGALLKIDPRNKYAPGVSCLRSLNGRGGDVTGYLMTSRTIEALADEVLGTDD